MSSYGSATLSGENDNNKRGNEGKRNNDRRNYRGNGRKQNISGRNNDTRQDKEGRDDWKSGNKRLQEEKNKIEQFVRNNTKPSPVSRDGARGNDIPNSNAQKTETRPDTSSTPSGAITAENVHQKSSLLFTLWQSTQKPQNTPEKGPPVPRRGESSRSQQVPRGEKGEKTGPQFRDLQSPPLIKDLITASFSVSNQFQDKEIVLVPRTRGGFSYAKVAKHLNKSRCPLDETSEHRTPLLKISYTNGGKKLFKEMPSLLLGKLLPEDQLASIKVDVPPNNDSIEIARTLGASPNSKDLQAVVFSPQCKFVPGELVLIPSPNGGSLVYGQLSHSVFVDCPLVALANLNPKRRRDKSSKDLKSEMDKSDKQEIPVPSSDTQINPKKSLGFAHSAEATESSLIPQGVEPDEQDEPVDRENDEEGDEEINPESKSQKILSENPEEDVEENEESTKEKTYEDTSATEPPKSSNDEANAKESSAKDYYYYPPHNVNGWFVFLPTSKNSISPSQPTQTVDLSSAIGSMLLSTLDDTEAEFSPKIPLEGISLPSGCIGKISMILAATSGNLMGTPAIGNLITNSNSLVVDKEISKNVPVSPAKKKGGKEKEGGAINSSREGKGISLEEKMNMIQVINSNIPIKENKDNNINNINNINNNINNNNNNINNNNIAPTINNNNNNNIVSNDNKKEEISGEETAEISVEISSSGALAAVPKIGGVLSVDKEELFKMLMTPKNKNGGKKKKHLIVLDGPNIAKKHGKDLEFSAEGIKIALDYWNAKGHDAIAFLPQHYVSKKPQVGATVTLGEFLTPKISNIPLLLDLVEKGQVVLTPPQDYDDSYCIQYALSHDGCIVTNDRYWDHIEKAGVEKGAKGKKQVKKWIRDHSISFTFVRDEFLPNPEFKFPPSRDEIEEEKGKK